MDFQETPLDFGNLPCLSTSEQDILVSLNDPEIAVSDVTRILQGDPVLAGRVVSVANHAFFAAHTEVRGIKDAVLRLGLKRVRMLVASAVLLGEFNTRACPSFSLSTYWAHAMTTANAAERIAVDLGVTPSRAQLAGLLHSIGLLLMAHLHPQLIDQALRAWQHDSDSPLAIHVREYAGVDYYEAGAVLASHWGLPEAVAAVLRGFAGGTPSGESQDLYQIVEAASGWASNELADAATYLTPLGLDATRIGNIATSCIEEAQAIKALADGVGGMRA